MPLKSGKEGNAMYCNIDYGPTFGGGRPYDSYIHSVPNSCDLCISNAPNSNDNSAYLNNAHQCPSGQNDETFLTRGETFRLSEMEVFRL